MSAAAILQGLARRASVEAPVALVAAHPDDETIGAGASLRLFRRLLLVHVTDGAPRHLRDARAAGFESAATYAAARRSELVAALRAGDAKAELAELGAPDQQAALHMAELAAALVAHLAPFRPACVISHPYEGGHPDHDAACLIAHLACARLGRVGLVEMTSYHAGADGELVSGAFLGNGAAMVVALAAGEQARKRAMLDCFATQRETLAQFGVAQEAFRPAPAYDFTAPPHPGPVHYERHNWGITGARWRVLAREAMAAWQAG